MEPRGSAPVFTMGARSISTCLLEEFLTVIRIITVLTDIHIFNNNTNKVISRLKNGEVEQEGE